MSLLPCNNLQHGGVWKREGGRALWQAVSSPKWCCHTQLHPRMPQMWPADSICEGEWQDKKHAQEARWKDMSQNKLGHQITSDQLWMKLVGSGSEKAKHHRNPSPKCPKTKNDPFASLPQAAERAPLKSCKTKSMAAVGGQKPYRNLAWTKTKLDLVGSGCEKAT